VDERWRDQLPSGFEALADTRGVMTEAAEHLTALFEAGRRFGEALVAAGLPQSAWRSQHASLRLLSDSLPEVSVGGWLARVEAFAAHDGLAWLHGTSDDLATFRAEVATLQAIAGPLYEAVQRLHRPTIGSRPDRPIQRVFRHPGVLPSLQGIAVLLGDLAALAPFLRPLAAHDWPAASSVRHGVATRTAPPWLAGDETDGPEAGGGVTFAPTRRLGGLHLSAALGTMLASLRQHGASLLRPLHARSWQSVGVALGVLLLVVAALVLAHHPTAPSTASHASGPATGGAHRATPRPTPTSQQTTPAPQATGTPTLQLALTCVVHGTTATLTLRNVGPAALRWQAKPPPTLRVTPDQGTLGVGQTTTAQVSALHKKTATGTVVVTATQGTASTSSSVDCR
jgi:hypothetical protein